LFFIFLFAFEYDIKKEVGLHLSLLQ